MASGNQRCSFSAERFLLQRYGIKLSISASLRSYIFKASSSSTVLSSNLFFMTTAGLPPTMQYGSTSLVTTEFAAITAPSPILTPGAHANPYPVADNRIAFADIRFFNLFHKRVAGKPIHTVCIIAAHQDNGFGADTHIIADIKLVIFPQWFKMCARIFVSVQIAHDIIFKIRRISITVVTLSTFNDNIRIFNCFIQVFDFGSVFLFHVFPRCRR